MTSIGPGIPTLRTDRLILRAPRIDDFAAYAELMASSRAAHMGGPFDERGAWSMFCHDVAQWELFGHGALMVDRSADGVCVGQVGINHGPLFPEKEIGWLLYDGFEGQGYATEAAKTLLNWAFAERDIDQLVSYIDTDNSGSIAVAVRLGGRPDRSAPRPDSADLVYRYKRD